jgi:hypothetical protein
MNIKIVFWDVTLCSLAGTNTLEEPFFYLEDGQQIPPKCQHLPTTLHSITSQKTTITMVTLTY